MKSPINTSPEIAEALDRIAEASPIEEIPEEFPDIGGFAYFVLPADRMIATHAFGGYDAYDDEADQIESTIFIADAIPKHVRGLLVGHLLLHKIHDDDGSPHLCGQHDKSIQAVVADREPSLLEPFYREAAIMYRQGYDAHLHLPGVPPLVIERYGSALKNSQARGQMAEAATDIRKRLEDQGLVLPDGTMALTAVDKRNGSRTHVSLQTERADRHKCRNCSNPIPKGSSRITTSTKQPVGGYDHHHYHPGCFTHIELGIFSGLQQVSAEESIS